MRESTKPCTFLKMPAESALSGRHFQEGIGREPATEMERSGIEVRSTALYSQEIVPENKKEEKQ